MKKTYPTMGVLALLFALANPAIAARQNTTPTNTPTGQQIQAGNAGEEAQIRTENEERTGSGSSTGEQLRLEDRQRLMDGTGTGTQAQNQIRNQGQEQQAQNQEAEGRDDSETGIENAEQRRSQVANAVQEMLQIAERNGGIGQEIKTIAQNQEQNQEQLESSLEKIQNRNGFVKFFIGPNFGEINNAQQLLEQNREQTLQLNEIQTRLNNQRDSQNLQERIRTLEQANLGAENILARAQKGFSLLGWLFKLIYGK